MNNYFMQKMQRSKIKTCPPMSKPFVQRLNLGYQPTLKLMGTQAKAISRYFSKLNKGQYTEEPRSSVCGAKDGILIAQIDRYGIPLNTVLCEHCGLMRSDPYLTIDSLYKFYCNDYRKIYSCPSDVDGVFFKEEKVGQNIERQLSQKKQPFPSTVFEIGCGAGGEFAPLSKKGCYSCRL